MELKFRCSGCGAKLAADEELISQKVACPRCAIAVLVPRPSLPPGAILGGFRIDHLLGYGSMGEVFLANQMSMDRPVALKVLPKALTADQENVDFFKNEVRTLARLDHPNIVGAFEAGEHQGMHFLAMTFVDGESLAEKVERDGPMDEFEALRVISKVARALEYAWDKFKLLHRDVKPANIMIDSYGDVKLMDLGLAKNFNGNETGAERFAYGTPDYMSPEQIRALNNLDFRTDVYALGCTLYHLVAGVTPYPGAGPQDVVEKQLHAPVPSVRKVKPDVSEGTDLLIQSMLAKSADQRPTSWGSLMQEIRRCQRYLETDKAGASHNARNGTNPKVKLPVAATTPDYGRPVMVETRKSRAPLLAAFLVGLIVIIFCTWFGLAWLENQPVKDPAGGLVVKPPLRGDPPLSTALIPLPPASTELVDVPPPVAPITPTDIDPDAPPKPTAAELDKVAEDMRNAELYEFEHSADIDGAITRYTYVIDAKSGLPVEERARDAVKRLQVARNAAIAQVIADLRAQAHKLADKQDYKAATTLVREYSGRYADVTGKQRDQIARDIDKRLRDKLAAEDKVKRQSLDALDTFAAALAKSLLTNELNNLPALIDAAANNKEMEPNRADAKALSDAALDAARYRLRIATGLQKLVGVDKPQAFTVGKDVQQVVVQGMDGAKIKGKKQVGTGFVGTSFMLDELSYEDKLRLVGTEATPAASVVRGLLAEYYSHSDVARTAFEQAGDYPLAVALLNQFDILHAAAPGSDVNPDPTAPGNVVTPTPPTAVTDTDVPRDHLILWLRADAGVDADRRNLVRGWSDQSGKNHHATSDQPRTRPKTARSELNGQPIVMFDGTDAYLKLPTDLINRAPSATFFIVLALEGDALDASTRPFGCAGAQNDDKGNFFRLDFWGIGDAGKPSFTISTSRKSLISAVGPTQRARYTGGVIFSVVMDPGGVVFRDNGNAGPTMRNAWGADARLASDGDKYLGASFEEGAPNGYFKGGIAEVLLYDQSLNGQQVSQIESYLSRKYGIAVGTNPRFR